MPVIVPEPNFWVWPVIVLPSRLRSVVIDPEPKGLVWLLVPSDRRVIVPELNMGQLCRIVRAEYLVDARSISKVQGLPFSSAELEQAILDAHLDATKEVSR